jgi:hypothetical protein
MKLKIFASVAIAVMSGNGSVNASRFIQGNALLSVCEIGACNSAQGGHLEK